MFAFSQSYNFPKLPKLNFDPTHLDNGNLERLELMFYLKNSRYNPMRNRIYTKYLKNETTSEELGQVNEENLETNITKVLENINNEFIKAYKHQIDEDEREEIELEKELKPLRFRYWKPTKPEIIMILILITVLYFGISYV